MLQGAAAACDNLSEPLHSPGLIRDVGGKTNVGTVSTPVMLLASTSLTSQQST
jgi:hypothetical protein